MKSSTLLPPVILVHMGVLSIKGEVVQIGLSDLSVSDQPTRPASSARPYTFASIFMGLSDGA